MTTGPLTPEAGQRTLFVSDVHLSRARPDITEQFEHFLASTAREAGTLYILGDLFEAWIGDDAIGPFEARIAAALGRCAEAGTAIRFLNGNRDFLLGRDYCQRARMTWLQQPCRIDLYGTPALVLHGDSLCTRDLRYQRYRARVLDPDWQRRILRRPVWFRRGLAKLLRGASRLRSASLARKRSDRNPGGDPGDDPTDVAPEAVARALADSGLGLMIHGHTHRPARHALVVDDTPRERVVLGDWYTQGSVLIATPERLRLQSLPRD